MAVGLTPRVWSLPTKIIWSTKSKALRKSSRAVLTGQSIALRYLPNSALRLARVSRFSMNFVGFWLLSLTLPIGLDERHPQNNNIMLKVMLEKWHHANIHAMVQQDIESSNQAF